MFYKIKPLILGNEELLVSKPKNAIEVVYRLSVTFLKEFSDLIKSSFK